DRHGQGHPRAPGHARGQRRRHARVPHCPPLVPSAPARPRDRRRRDGTLPGRPARGARACRPPPRRLTRRGWRAGHERHSVPAARGACMTDETALRQAIIDQCRWMNATGLNQGTSGNISVRYGDEMLITPSGIPYDGMTPEMIAAMPLGRTDGTYRGPLKPSSEWRIHRDILSARPEAGAVVHTHSTYATALAITRRGIPPCHYMVAAFGGEDVRCSDYARFGTQELSDAAIAALEGRNGCLL